MIPPTFTGLEGLLDLGRRDGVDIRTTLLRVLTDQYVQHPAHSPEEESHYTELALRLLDEADVPTRATVAARLALHPSAPREVIQRLARDVIEVAGQILRQSPCLTANDLEAIVRVCGPEHAESVAARSRPLAASEGAAKTAAEKSVVEKTTPAKADATELCELFFAAGGPERRLILMNLEYAASIPSTLTAALQRADVWRLETAALQHRTGAVMQELQSALGVSSRMAQRIVDDDQGEPIVVAAKAMMLPADVLQRVLLFLNPRVGRSIDRVYDLAGLYGEITVDAASRLIAIWRDAEPAERKTPRHEPSEWRNAAENARRALSEISPRPATQRDTLMVGERAAKMNQR